MEEQETAPDAKALDINPESIEYKNLGTGNTQTYDIHLQTGEVTDLDNDTSLGCISDDRIVEFYEIFNGAEICKTPEPEENAFCTMIYKAPYATLVFADSEKIVLGEKVNGCASETLLCAEKNQQLQELMNEIRTNPSSEITACN